MAMLAESRSRQKWSDDPRNTRWSNDTSKFGYQMLTRMGWSEGKGLGQNETGQTSHVKVTKRKGNSGIGTKRSHDDDWISHQNDFNDLLSALNQGSTDEKASGIKSLEDRVKSSKKKILYTKFVKSKDLSNASSQDLACIFGTRAKSAPVTPNLSEDEGNDSDASAASCPPVADHIHEHGFTTVNTGVSVADYFAKKMAALKNIQNENNSNSNEEQKITKKKSKNDDDDDDDCINIKTSIDVNTEVKKKKKKKRKHDSEDEIEIQQKSSESEDQELKSKKTKKKRRKTVDVDNIKQDDETVNDELVEDKERKSKKKKKKKKNNVD